jgi:flagellar assembly protein FliH
MSVKVLTGKAAAKAQPIQWPSLTSGNPDFSKSSLAIAPPAEIAPPQTQENLAVLERQVQKLKAESEQRIQEARSAGKLEGEQAARESIAANLNVEVERMKQLTKELLASAPALRKQAEGDLVRLAIAIARRILHREIAVDSEALLGLTKAALSKIDTREIHVVRTHPDNVNLVQRVLEGGRSQKRIEILGDARLDRGALIIETARGEFDSSVETHLEEIERGFADLVGNQS